MSGNHRADQSSRARVAVAGALTAGALLLAPAGAAVIAAPGIANAAPVSGTTTTTPTTPTVHKTVIHLPGLEIEIKDTVGDHKLPKIKFVPFPRLHFPR